MTNPYDVEFCQDCHRPKSRNADEASWGFCDKSRAFRDPEAEKDCNAFAEARKKRVVQGSEIESLRAKLKEKDAELERWKNRVDELNKYILKEGRISFTTLS